MGGITEGLTSTRTNFGQAAGEHVFSLCVKPGFISDQSDLHSEGVHVCSLADVIASSLRRKEPWKAAPSVDLGEGHTWYSDCFLEPNGEALRRVLCVSSWSPDRHYSVMRSWGTLGSMCAYGLPMKLAVVTLGQHREGRFHSPWAKGFLHPVSKQLRFRKKTGSGEGFKSSWQQVFREDRAEISTGEWLGRMLNDGVLEDNLQFIEVPLPSNDVQKMIRELAIRRLNKIYDCTELPDQQLSTCYWPRKCTFLSNCLKGDTPNGRYGFVKISEIG